MVSARKRTTTNKATEDDSKENNNNNNKAAKKKKVHFNKDCDQVTVIEDSSSLTQEEKSATWYSRNDLMEIRIQSSSSSSSCCTCIQENKKVLGGGHHQHQLPVKCSSCNNCNAGQKQQQQQQQHEFVVNLLNQQREHKLMGGVNNDPRGLFQFSRACSKMSRQRALTIGREQAKEVKSFEQIRKETLSIVDEALELLMTPSDDVVLF